MKQLFSFFCLFLFFSSCAQVQPPSYFYVRTTDSLPFLNYGLGTDRLGGAKMTFLDSNVVLRVVDSIGANYKVQLSAQHSAFIEKRHVRMTDSVSEKTHLSGAWSVYGDSLYDYVMVSLEEKPPYRSRMLIHPSRIEVDIFGVVSNTNWITQLKTAREVKNVWHEQYEDDVMKVVIELEHRRHWGYEIFYADNNRLVIKVKRQPEKPLLRNLVIAVDAGHGGEHTGARSITRNAAEKDYTLLMAKELQRQLSKRGATVIMTRETDTTLSMYERIRFLKAYDPHLLISLHLNSSSKEYVKGTSTYYRYIGFKPLSVAILDEMLDLDLENFGNIGSFNFSLNGPTEFPNTLVEVAFLSKREDEKRILDPEFHKQVARKIIAGIETFLKEL